MIFNSFFMGGYECADHINRSGRRINLLKETQHNVRVREDYALLSALGITTVREGICWSSVEQRPFIYDFREVQNRIAAAGELGIQQIWDLCHFGYPDGLIPTHPNFTERFTSLCTAFADFYKQCTDAVLFVVPINEISFLSWHSGDVRGTVPFAINSGFDIKYHLCKAAIAGIKALKDADPGCRVLMVEPLVQVHGREEDDWNTVNAENENQFQAMDIIAGRMCPELEGNESLLDLLGFNYYHNNQWRHNSGPLPWPDLGNERKALCDLLCEAYQRYQRPIILTETGHFGEGRALWLHEISGACETAMQLGVDLLGICIYPVTDRPDWDQLDSYCRCGLWDLDEEKNRVPDDAYINSFLCCRDQLSKSNVNR